MNRRAIVLAVMCVLGCALVLTAQPTFAMSRMGPLQTTPTLTIYGLPYPDDVVHVVGFGYTAGETALLYFDGKPVGSTIARQAVGIVGGTAGYIVAQVTIPGTATAGAHTISAIGQTSGVVVQGTVNVQAVWRQVGFAATGGRYNLTDTAISPANVKTLALDWKWTDPNAYSVDATAASVVGNSLYFGTADGMFHAWNANTGASQWDVYLPANLGAQPVASDTTIYTTGYYLWALDPKTGSDLWDTANVQEIFLNPPTLANGLLYVGGSRTIYAFNPAGCGQLHCAPLWQTPVNGQDMDTTPIIANGVMYAVSQEGTLFAYNASTGAQLWSAVADLNNFARMPVVANGVVYVASTDGHLYAFSATGCGAATCSPLWKGVAGGALDSIPALANDVVYVGSDDNNLYAFNANGCGAATCSPLWKGTTSGKIESSPAVANGVVYVGSYDNSMYAFNAAGCGAATCASDWSYATGGQIWGSPTVVNGILYFGSRDNTFYAFHLPGASLMCTRTMCRSAR